MRAAAESQGEPEGGAGRFTLAFTFYTGPDQVQQRIRKYHLERSTRSYGGMHYAGVT